MDKASHLSSLVNGRGQVPESPGLDDGAGMLSSVESIDYKEDDVRFTTLFRSCMIPAFVACLLVGCGGGRTQDDGPSNAPALTKESLKSAADEINAQGKGMGPANGKK